MTTMDARTLGTDGPMLSVIGLGCNNFGMKIDAEAAAQVVRAAIDSGVMHFDTAEMYGGGRSETFLGAALGGHRDEAVIATKFSPRPQGEAYEPGALARRIRDACDGSLQRLGTDRIDLYYQHYPDLAAPIDEVLEALQELVSAGKVLHIATSNVTGAQIAAAAASARAGGNRAAFCAVQVEWNLLSRDVEAEVVPSAREMSMGVVPYFPLASGMLTGKYRRSEGFPEGSRLATMSYFADVANEHNFATVERLQEFAQDHGRTLIELAVGWLLAQDGVASVIAGATSAQQIITNAAAGAWALTEDDVRAVETVLAGDSRRVADSAAELGEG